MAGWCSRSLLDLHTLSGPLFSQSPLHLGAKSLQLTLPQHLDLDGNPTVLGVIHSHKNHDWWVDFTGDAWRGGRRYLYHTHAREQVHGRLLKTPLLLTALPFLGLFYIGTSQHSASSCLIIISFGPSEFYLPVLVSHLLPLVNLHSQTQEGISWTNETLYLVSLVRNYLLITQFFFSSPLYNPKPSRLCHIPFSKLERELNVIVMILFQLAKWMTNKNNK